MPPKETTTTRDPPIEKEPPFKVLIFSRTTGYRHDSIPAGISALQDLATTISTTTRNPFTAHASEDASTFDNPHKLRAYRVIILLQTSGDFLSPAQLTNFQNYVEKDGGGVVGIHCASCGHPSSEWHSSMIGAVFADHPAPQTGTVKIVDPNHPITTSASVYQEHVWPNTPPPEPEQQPPGSDKRKRTAISDDDDDDDDCTTNQPPPPSVLDPDPPATSWTWHDEWYNFRLHPTQQTNNPNLHILMTVDESTYTGGKHGTDHPIAWCQEFEKVDNGNTKETFSSNRGNGSAGGKEKPLSSSEKGGRSYYTALGHFDEAFQDSRFMSQVMAGIE